MTAEDFNITQNKDFPEISVEFGKTINIIVQSIKSTCIPYKKAICQPNLILPLNENKLTQIFVGAIRQYILACKIFGCSWDRFYRFKELYDQEVELALHEVF